MPLFSCGICVIDANTLTSPLCRLTTELGCSLVPVSALHWTRCWTKVLFPFSTSCMLNSYFHCLCCRALYSEAELQAQDTPSHSFLIGCFLPSCLGKEEGISARSSPENLIWLMDVKLMKVWQSLLDWAPLDLTLSSYSALASRLWSCGPTYWLTVASGLHL